MHHQLLHRLRSSVARLCFPVMASYVTDAANEIQKSIATTIQNNKVTIFSKSTCSYCNEVKQLFNSLNISFKAVELDKEENGSKIQSELATLTGQRTVPNVFVNGTHIGGCDSTKKAHQEGRLMQLYSKV